jgi:DNA-binding HxlR family transcriptional regulator
VDAASLPRFFHHRWTAPILAELHRTNGAKFITLVARLGIPRETLVQTLGALIRSGWVRRNPGHGHPMRPEYLPTAKGRRLGGACERLMFEIRRRDLEGVALKKWSMPVLHALAGGARRFSELKRGLGPVTTRALTLAIRDLVTAGLVRRTVTQSTPPSVRYGVAADSRQLRRWLTKLA